jgi:hypothetical protein
MPYLVILNAVKNLFDALQRKILRLRLRLRSG